MALNLMSIKAAFEIETAKFEKGLQTAKGAISGFKSGVQSVVSSAAKAIEAIGVGAVVKKGFDAIQKGVGEVATLGDHIDKASQKLGISAEAYQEWDAVMQHSGTSIDAMGAGMKAMATAVTENGAAFEKLGISQEKAAAMSREDLFAATIEALQGMEDANERAQVAQELFGRSAMELGPLLNTSAEDTRAMRDRVKELGGVMSDGAVKDAAAYQDALQDMNTSFDGLKNNLFSKFLPIFTDVMNTVTEIMPGISRVAGQVIDGLVELWNGTLKPVFDTVRQVVVEDVMPNVQTALEGFADVAGEVFSGIETAWNETLQPALAAIYDYIVRDLIPTLIVWWEYKLQPTIETVFQGIAALWEDPLKPVFEALQAFLTETLMPMFGELAEAVGGFVENGVNLLAEALSGFVDGDGAAVVEWLKDTFGAAWTGVQEVMAGTLDFLTGIFSGDWEKAWNGLVRMASAPFETLGEILKKPINGVIDLVNKMIDAVENAVNWVVDGINSRLSISVPDWIPVVGGKSWSPNLSRIEWDRVKPLANGGIVRSGGVAMVGEYAPELLEVIGGQAVVTPLARTPGRLPGGETFTRTQYPSGAPDKQIIVLELDGAELARMALPYMQQEQVRQGVTIARG